MAYDDALRIEIAQLLADTQADLQDAGLVWAEVEVQLVTVTRTGANPAHGTTGTTVTTSVTLTPRPLVTLREVWRADRRVGDATLKIPRASLSAATLAGAAYFLLDGVRYTVADGYTQRGPLFWEVVLTRARA
jgi:hypothetical protein